MGRRSRFSGEVRERSIRLVLEHQGEYSSRWEAMRSIAAKIGCTAETLRKWVTQWEVDAGQRGGARSDDQARLKELERDNPPIGNATQSTAAAFWRRNGVLQSTALGAPARN